VRLPRADLVRRLAGLLLVAVGAIGLSVTVLDWNAARDCIIQSEGRMAFCASPSPAFLFGVWFLLGSMGTFLAVRR
jgi:hypothetical protein